MSRHEVEKEAVSARAQRFPESERETVKKNQESAGAVLPENSMMRQAETLNRPLGVEIDISENSTMQQALTLGESYLADRGIEDAPLDAWLLLEYVTGMSRARFLADRGFLLDEPDRERYLELLKKRGAHIPLQHLTGVQEFMGFPFRVNEHVLVPRQDTESLVEQALMRLRPGMAVLDLCTGSGCIAVSLAKLCPGLRVDASDISQAALRVARANGQALDTSVNWIHSDLFENIPKKKNTEGHPTGETYDLIVSNPPYIPTNVIGTLAEEVRLHEPFKALDGREDGLYFYRRIVREARDYLRPGGFLLFEIGWDQAAEVSGFLEAAGYGEISVVKDLAGLDRVVSGRL